MGVITLVGTILGISANSYSSYHSTLNMVHFYHVHRESGVSDIRGGPENHDSSQFLNDGPQDDINQFVDGPQ